MANGDFKKLDNYTAQIGGTIVWIESYPFAAFRPSGGSVDNFRMLPKRRTVAYAMDKLRFDTGHKIENCGC